MFSFSQKKPEKKRLYVALYPSGVVNNEERKYHWAFLVGPKVEDANEVPGDRYHVKNSPLGVWEYEELPLRNVRNTVNLLVRLVIGKVEDEERLIKIFRQVPLVQNDESWRCRTWVKEALGAIAKDGQAVGSAVLEWEKIEAKARSYVADKTAGGRFNSVEKLAHPKPTWDMTENKEEIA
ncbi:hypothetical protein MGYG_04050 [Nannizzia gypsea CBS 118893]|uniref:Uncharacterized protein n=1 Tax=Arthroderma gypseum (strain ATCC MYA-4604 / CBS 118893) TaxID=535722 RepID=E4UUT0_ARTGP|nr:hypothetical protein MGYG_04050 [Nannizzia gypsea CBS 118893]EFR01047.1 hypothetical protein MGYG_04050 [Nannizzia gypsea CBS 118893]